MTTGAYTEVLQLVERLTRDEQEQLLAELAVRVHQSVEPDYSVREFRGLGKEVWDGIDAQAYINQERDAWDG
jgi:hypothetical protein